MKKMLAALLLIGSTFFVFAQTNQSVSIIPLPVSVATKTGSFTVTSKTAIELSSTGTDASRVARFLSQAIATPAGFKVPVTNKRASGNVIRLSILNTPDKTLGDEGYKLSVTQNAVNLSANKPAGLFYGVQTILQLLPREIESKTAMKNISWAIPAVEITDYPRFGWRGLMFDVSRHFFTKQDVKDFIDNMVKYKYNLLHLHLTDDQGWRIEIKNFPNLTKVGAWRAKREGAWSNTTAPDPGEPKTYGGFYTQDDIRELVQYAKDRFVTVLPKIDVPAHSMAALAAYRELSCTPRTYAVNAGEEFQVWDSNGNRALVDTTLCPANEKVYDFLDK